jgi:hypothetical protein
LYALDPFEESDDPFNVLVTLLSLVVGTNRLWGGTEINVGKSSFVPFIGCPLAQIVVKLSNVA